MDIYFLKAVKRKENLDILRKEINNKWVTEKLKNHLERNPHLKINVEQFREFIRTDDLLASFIAKDPSKQNITENVIGDYLSSVDSIDDFINHNSSVKLFIVKGNPTTERIDGLKSVDYSWKTNNKNVYTTQKYTTGNGGHQDNQFNDVISFLLNCKGESENFYLAIVDGSYYSDTRLNILKKYETDNIKVCSFMEVEEVLKSIK